MTEIKNPFDIFQQATGQFDLSHGFLPATDPIQSLPEAFHAWEQTTRELPKLLTANQLRSTVEKLPSFETRKLQTGAQLERAMMLLSYLGHAYVWGSPSPTTAIPAILAQPWYEVATELKRPPVLSYASYALYNWRKIDRHGAIELGNIVLLQNFLGGIDEEWFILIHVAIEARAALGLIAMSAAQHWVKEKNNLQLVNELIKISAALQQMCDVLDRMPEHCDPYIYYRRVRPYIHGWKNNPSLPQGLIYQGVKAYQNKPQQFKGETGAQSSIIPCCDAALGIVHPNDLLKVHLMEMRDYMPPSHRTYIEHLEKGPSIRQYVKDHLQQEPLLKTHYNECIKLLDRFRRTHIKYAAHYIQKQVQSSDANPTEIGTGGTLFMIYLREHIDTTDQFLL